MTPDEPGAIRVIRVRYQGITRPPVTVARQQMLADIQVLLWSTDRLTAVSELLVDRLVKMRDRSESFERESSPSEIETTRRWWTGTI